MIKPASLLFSLLLFAVASAQKTVKLSSPDGAILFTLQVQKNTLSYTVHFNNNLLVDRSPLSLVFDNGFFGNGLSAGPVQITDPTESYALLVGKTSRVTTRYKKATVPLVETKAPHRKINLVIKAFNDGLAFRYEMPAQEGWQQYALQDERTTFNLTGNPIVRALLLPNYTSSHEGLYTVQPLAAIKNDTLMDMPALFEMKNSVYLAITEAALLDYAGMYLTKEDGLLRSKLPQLPNSNIKVKAALPHRSPWRVLLIGNNAGRLMESNIITTLNEPSKIEDWSWLKPGKTTFPWWNGNVVPDTLNAPGNNFVTAQYYIDFCARNGIEYHSVVEYGLHQWYMDDGVGFQPGPNADVTKPVPGLNMKEICDYAATKGVGVRVWVHWAALYPRLDAAFAIFEQWGLKGMMIDFMDRDDQEMVNIQTEMLQKAAKHKLHIQFHGAYKPTGLHRTYPNELTREGTLNYETNKWNSGGLSPDHDINIPFTRMLAGASDYHMGGFRAVLPKDFKAQYTKPLMLGTRCHQLGMYVVLESYLGMACDYPDAYEGQAGFEFIKQVPVTWDETVVPLAVPGKYVAIARRKGSDWYVGAINNNEERSLNLSFSFLPEGSYEATIYKDAATSNPNDLIKEVKTVSAKDSLQLRLAAGGGAAVVLRKK